MNLVIVDDLKSDLKALQQLLSDYLEQHHVEYKIFPFSSGRDFLSVFHPNRFDAVFLDMQMDDISGMEIARHVRLLDSKIPIIFVTIEEGYALEGYSVWAMDYIVKPVSAHRLSSLMNRLVEQSKVKHIIEIKENRIVRHLLVDDILYVRSVGHFLEIYTTKELIKPYMTLEYFLSLLSQMDEYGSVNQGLRFQNCCRGYVVSLDYVRSLEPSNFILTNGNKVPISRPKYKDMQSAYAQYLFKKTRDIT